MILLRKFSVTLLIICLLTSCTTPTTVYKADLTKSQGVYVMAYVADPVVRARVENQIVEALTAQNIVAHASNADILNITSSSRNAIIRAANGKQTVGVLVVNQVAADASDSVVADPKRISPQHPDLQAFYKHAQSVNQQPGAGEERVLVEINLFLLDGDDAKLYWSGTAWSIADGRGSAGQEISTLVAGQLAQIRKRMVPES